jgi:hypothetical protein
LQQEAPRCRAQRLQGVLLAKAAARPGSAARCSNRDRRAAHCEQRGGKQQQQRWWHWRRQQRQRRRSGNGADDDDEPRALQAPESFAFW